jgi:5-(carboxyamino)imidazole ribonucleotide synthase
VLGVSNAPADHELTRVGVVGAGQLARMMGDEAHAVDVVLTVLALTRDDAAIATADDVVIGDPHDLDALTRLSERVDVVTFDHELVDLNQVEHLESRGVVVRPGSAALRFAVDKAHQRTTLAMAGLPVPRFVVVTSSDDPGLATFLVDLDAPPVLKAARGGYDGRGVLFPGDRDETLTMIDRLATSGPVLVEERLDLGSEVSQLVVRAVDGSIALYPLVTTVQSDGMCVEVRFPAEATDELENEAAGLAERIAALIDVVGVLAIEFFVTARGLVVNEVALRPHNSGHWTIEGAATSQFANHLRAVSGQTLGDTKATTSVAVMVNVVGADSPSSLASARGVADAHVHDYGKSWRPGRKLGHVTVIGDDAHVAHVRAWECATLYGTRTKEV